jgi:hypothetical protein
VHRQLTRSPTRADDRKLLFSSIVVKDPPWGTWPPQPIAAQVSARASAGDQILGDVDVPGDELRRGVVEDAAELARNEGSEELRHAARAGERIFGRLRRAHVPSLRAAATP